MTTYISILRGINVGGQKKIRMEDLKALYESLNFNDVITYIQSGNVIFKTVEKITSTDLQNTIEEAIQNKYGFHVPVIVKTVEEIQHTIKNNPFIEENNIDKEKLHVTFLAEVPAKSNLEKLHTYNFPPDRFLVIGKDIYLSCPVNYGNSKLSNNFFESKLKVTATTRNWRTVNTLLELAMK